VPTTSSAHPGRPHARRSLRFERRGVLIAVALAALAVAGPRAEVGAQSSLVGIAQKSVGTLTVVRTDGVENYLRGSGSLPLFEGDVLKTAAGSKALVMLREGIQVALNEGTTAKLISRWERAKGVTPIIRVGVGEIWAKSSGEAKTLDVETPAATAFVQEVGQHGIEFTLSVAESGDSTLTVQEGIVGFGTSFGTCPIRAGTVSFGARGKRCTKPEPFDTRSTTAWKQGLVP